MSRLSKTAIALHREAERLLTLDRLDDDQRQFVLDNWQESARHINSSAGAFFTPSGLARDLGLFAGGDTVIDLCAGIGALGLWTWWQSGGMAKVTCIEVNPDYVEVGRKIFPEATWICGSVETAPGLGKFDVAISNPPFGRTSKVKGVRYSGEDDLAVVDIASDVADYGTFILPTNSCPFQYSGSPSYRVIASAKYDRFVAATGISLSCASVDCGYYRDEWRGVSPHVEMASADFSGVRAAREDAQRDLLSALAA